MLNVKKFVILLTATLWATHTALAEQNPDLNPVRVSDSFFSCAMQCKNDYDFCQKTPANLCSTVYTACMDSCRSIINRDECTWVGFIGDADRNEELMRQAPGLKRIQWADGQNPTFSGLCKTIGLDCKSVKDWEGRGDPHWCDETEQDKNRAACCKADPD